MKNPAASAVLMLVLAIPATNARADFSQNFEVDTSGWFPIDTDSVNQEPDGYVSPVPYASGVTSASPTEHARLRRPDQCVVDQTGAIGPSVLCFGPFTRWGGYSSTWLGGYTTQVDVYLDVTYALENPDSIHGDSCLTTTNSSETSTSCKGTRFDYTSAINDSNGNFFEDFAFSVGTGNPTLFTPCPPPGGFVVFASANLFRSGVNIYDPNHDSICIANSGWYTFKHTFKDVGGSLQVLMEIFPLGSGVPLHQWTITPGRPITEVGCNRYGWFANQEIWDLAIDNSIMVGCGTPLPTTTTTTTPSSTLPTTTTLSTTTTLPTTTTTTSAPVISTTTSTPVVPTTSTTLPPEICEPLTITQASFRPPKSTLFIRATFPDGTFAGLDPRQHDVHLQVRGASGDLVSCTIPSAQWQKLFQHTFGFFDQSLTLCPPIKCLSFAVPKKGQPRMTITAGGVQSGSPLLSPLEITVSAVDECAAGPLTLQPKAAGRVVFP
jgi:hypothetical protein